MRAIVAIGSSVRTVEFSADLDLLLFHEGRAPHLETPPIDVDLRAIPIADVASRLQNGNDRLGWAVLFGRVIFERGNYWSGLVGRWSGKMPLPSAEEAFRRAEKAKTLVEDLANVGDEDAADEQRISMLTHLARGNLIRSGIYPTSRPELPAQLRKAGYGELAEQLESALPAGHDSRVRFPTTSPAQSPFRTR